MDEYLRKLVEAPLADPTKLYLPQGKSKAPRGPKAVYEGEEMPKISGKQLQERKEKEASKKMASILNYYATTDVPFDRIAQHTGLNAETVVRVMKARGRES